MAQAQHCYQLPEPQTHRLTAAATLTAAQRTPNNHLHSLTLTEPSAVTLWGVGKRKETQYPNSKQGFKGKVAARACGIVCVCVLAPCVCVFLPLETSLISLLTAAISFRARQRTATVLSRWPKITWLSRLSSSSKCESMVTAVELAGSGTQADDSLAQLHCSIFKRGHVRIKS